MPAQFKRAVEIGAGDSRASEFLTMRGSFDRIDLYEPHAVLFSDLYMATKTMNNVRVHNLAISNSNRMERFYNLGYTSFLHSAYSPLRLSCDDKINEAIALISTIATVLDINSIDDGFIDCLSLSCNGSELAILSALRSRPKGISLKYFNQSPKHIAYYNKVTQWMSQNGYVGTVLRANSFNTMFHMGFNLK